jgi:PadR family transcriptional regulator, regulatory protein AphA
MVTLTVDLYGTRCTVSGAMSERNIRLTSTSYVVLGMLDWLGPSTPYRLKRVMAQSVEDFFPVPHGSFYAEPARLAAAGYVSEDVEAHGRRRKTYALTDRGREALQDWLAQPETRFGEFRFPGMLKIFFGADPGGFAGAQAAHHAGLAERFEGIREQVGSGELELTPQRRAVLEKGIALHRWWEARWSELEASGLLK